MNGGRREFLRNSIKLMGVSFLPLSFMEYATRRDEKPRFFIQLMIAGGADWSYLFDARPLQMTQEGLIQNYLGKEPKPWEGINGVSTLATELVDPLRTLQQYFSVLPGVHMSTSFDGHGQNMDFYFSGNSFGGEIFIPHLNSSEVVADPALLDYLQVGRLFMSSTNSGNSVALGAESGKKLSEKAKEAKSLDLSTDLNRFIASRFDANSKGGGLFSKGSAALKTSLLGAPDMATRLKDVQISNEKDPFLLSLELVREYFKTGLTRSAILNLGADDFRQIDAHSANQCKELPKTFEKYVGYVKTLIEFLRDTPFDSEDSMLERTTFVLTSEFGRTMRQKRAASIDESGTDHNVLANLMLVGGHGVLGGKVFGETDFRKKGEKLSQAHLNLDPDEVRTMGKPFNFQNGYVPPQLPDVYEARDYLTCGSVVNSLYKFIGVDPKLYRTLGRDKKECPIVPDLFKNA